MIIDPKNAYWIVGTLGWVLVSAAAIKFFFLP